MDRLDGIHFNFRLHRGVVKAPWPPRSVLQALLHRAQLRNVRLGASLRRDSGKGQVVRAKAFGHVCSQHGVLCTAHLACTWPCTPSTWLAISRGTRLAYVPARTAIGTLWSRNGDDNGIRRESMTSLE